MTIGPNLATTQMACPGIRARLEQAYMAALPKVRKFEATKTQLTLLDSSGQALLRYTASNPGEAIKGSWEATMIYTGTALQSPVQGSTLTATFDGTQISGDSGCNTFSGTYTTSGATIAIGTLASTTRACADPAVDTQEQQYLTALSLAKTFAVAGNRLDLYREGGTYAASYTRTKGAATSTTTG
jgi:heat shock protein HslJ